MSIGLIGKSLPTGFPVYHETTWVDGKSVETGAFVIGPLPTGAVIPPKEAARLAAYLTGQPVPPYEPEDPEPTPAAVSGPTDGALDEDG